MSDYEHMIVSVVRYALGRMTYIVELIVNYIIKDIEENKLSKFCLVVMLRDIKTTDDLGWDCDKQCWQRLIDKIEEVL